LQILTIILGVLEKRLYILKILIGSSAEASHRKFNAVRNKDRKIKIYIYISVSSCVPVVDYL
jgi:spore coat polysaccharide biosynthesis predicted glycosyltransferase SpsG